MQNLNAADVYACGGQAEVYMMHWRPCPQTDTGIIQPGDFVAIKRIHRNSGGRRFRFPSSRQEVEEADRQSVRGQRIELNLLSLLHARGCGARVVKPLAVFRFPGQWSDDPAERAKYMCEPCNGYVMKAYPLGSLRVLLRNICSRRVPESVGQRFLSMCIMSAEYATLLGELHKIHTLPSMGLMIQDLTPANLLVDDGPEGMRLLFSDPAMAQPIKLLRQRRAGLCGTWLWGSMLVRHNRFDQTADLYSLSFAFAEAWLVAEGAVNAPMNLIMMLGADQDKAQGVQFMRRLVWEVLRLHHLGATGIGPRVQRHQPVSWLGAWLLLLGFRDYSCTRHMNQDLPCLRPSEESMLKAARLWARIAAVAEGLPLELTDEQMQSPATASLVEDLVLLQQLLTSLSHLGEAGEQEDPALAWCAANFLEQRHPLVAAMKERGARGVGAPEPPCPYAFESADWHVAIHRAQQVVLPPRDRAAADLAALQDEFEKRVADFGRQEREFAQRVADFNRQRREFEGQLEAAQATRLVLQGVGQWYKDLQLRVMRGAIPAHLAHQLVAPNGCHLELVLAAGGGTAGSHAAPGRAAQPEGAAPLAPPAMAAHPGQAAPARNVAPATARRDAAAPPQPAGPQPQPAAAGAGVQQPLAGLPNNAALGPPNQRPAVLHNRRIQDAAAGSGAAAGLSAPRPLHLPAGGARASQPLGASNPTHPAPLPAGQAPSWHAAMAGAAAAPAGGASSFPGAAAAGDSSPASSATHAAVQPNATQGRRKKRRLQDPQLEAYADALEQLIDLNRAPMSGDVFGPLKTRDHVLAFLRWWAEDGFPPSIPGLRFSSAHMSQYVRAVMDKAEPGQGLAAAIRDGTRFERPALVRRAAACVLRRLRQRWQLEEQGVDE